MREEMPMAVPKTWPQWTAANTSSRPGCYGCVCVCVGGAWGLPVAFGLEVFAHVRAVHAVHVRKLHSMHAAPAG